MQLKPPARTATLLAALGNEHRLRIVELLRGRDRCVCEITPEFALDPSVVSRHLAVLEQAGVVASRRVGKWIFYRIAAEDVLELVGAARRMANEAVAPESESRRETARAKPGAIRRPKGCCGRPAYPPPDEKSKEGGRRQAGRPGSIKEGRA